MTSRTPPGPAGEPGRRALQAITRNRAIEAAAMSLAEEPTWPSPKAVAERAGLSVAVVQREVGRLRVARLKWIELTGAPHPQWKNGEDTDIRARDPKPTRQPDEARAPSERQSARMKRLVARNEELEEIVRRLLLGLRPDTTT